MSQEKKIILLSGPTASGKSKLAIKLAKHFKGEIINADSMQVYKEISILNSKPIFNDRKLIKHHFYGFKPAKSFFSTGQWVKTVKKKIQELWKKNITPIVVGGTGLYFKALTEGLVKIPHISIEKRKKIRKLHKKIGQKAFFIKLIKIDPLAKFFLSPNDIQRSIRAYEVKKFTKKSFFKFIKETKPSFRNEVFKKIFINTPKNILHKKIEERVENMLREGAIIEVRNFNKLKVKNEMPSNKIIGIKEISDYLDNKITLNAAKELIYIKTRQYAKRQFTWARGQMKSWNMIYSSNFKDLFNKAINKIS